MSAVSKERIRLMVNITMDGSIICTQCFTFAVYVIHSPGKHAYPVEFGLRRHSSSHPLDSQGLIAAAVKEKQYMKTYMHY